jgi:NAD(P)-dependent dehydrogenase (short-subunit alcohol dehydrogenase family)
VAQVGAVSGIIHLSPLAKVAMPEQLTDWRYYTQVHTKSLFQLLSVGLEKLPGVRVLAASLLGGSFGRDRICSPGLPTGGSNNGLLKTLVKERPDITAKALDLDASLSADEMAQIVVQELLLPGGRLEVGYPQGVRTVFHTVLEQVKEETGTGISPSKDWVVLITGGARGITAEIARELVVPGMKLILLGKSPMPEMESVLTAGIGDRALLRQAFLKQGLALTPVQIERKIDEVLRDRSICSNLEELTKAGAIVEYLALDVRDEAVFGSLIKSIYDRFGRLDAVIHGAGIIEDKLIVDKSLASFDAVFDTKVDSTFILNRYLRSNLQLLVLFSSVAGRYGNRGQGDYAAANEVMNRFAWQMQQKWSSTRVVAINWGPWDSPGMANETVKLQFIERGVIPISVAAGRQFFAEELRYGSLTEVEVIAGEAPWEQEEAQQGQWLISKSAQADLVSSPISPALPFISTPVQLQPNSTVTLEHTFSLANDPYLQDHCLDGKPVVPAAVALEWIAEFVQSAWSEWVVAEIHELRVLRGLVLEENGTSVLFSARASHHADADGLEVSVEILDPVRRIPYYRAVAVMKSQLESAPTNPFLPLTTGKSLSPATVYEQYLFHGQRFQLVTAVPRLNEQGIDAIVQSSQPEQWTRSAIPWLFDPGVIDTAPQIAIAYLRVQQDSTPLPTRFGKVTRYGSVSPNTALNLAWRVTSAPSSDSPTLVYDAVFYDAKGKVYLYLQNIESTSSPALNRLANKL